MDESLNRDESLQRIVEAVHTYFDALYFGDLDRFARVLHPRARLYCATDRTLLELDLPGYLQMVRDRPSPASRHDHRYDRILAIDLASPTTAHVRVQDAYLPKLFTDELSFVRLDSDWVIVAKVWHYALITVDSAVR